MYVSAARHEQRRNARLSQLTARRRRVSPRLSRSSPDGDISSPDTAAVITSTNSNYLSGVFHFENHQLRIAIPGLIFKVSRLWAWLPFLISGAFPISALTSH